MSEIKVHRGIAALSNVNLFYVDSQAGSSDILDRVALGGSLSAIELRSPQRRYEQWRTTAWETRS